MAASPVLGAQFAGRAGSGVRCRRGSLGRQDPPRMRTRWTRSSARSGTRDHSTVLAPGLNNPRAAPLGKHLPREGSTRQLRVF